MRSGGKYMADIANVIVDIVALSGGKLVGRTRMQKTVYLLDVVGLGSGAAYYYYNFGPFSDEVANGISDSKFGGNLIEETENRMSDGSPFSIFKAAKPAEQINSVGRLPAEQAKRLLQRFAMSNATVLELAATIHWLSQIERVPDWRGELVRRKGSKTQNGRMDRAAALLNALGVHV
jgi:uncharacterized protein